MSNMYRVFCCLMVALSLTACAGGKESRLCPQVASVRELDRMTDYGRDKVMPENLVAVASMARIEGSCEYSDDGVDVLFDIHMAAKKGPRLGGNEASFPYFISLVSPQDKVVGKETMTERFSFEGDRLEDTKTESLRVYIPLEKGEDASLYRVLSGFQLTPEQLQEVRELDVQEARAKELAKQEAEAKAKELAKQEAEAKAKELAKQEAGAKAKELEKQGAEEKAKEPMAEGGKASE
ncbi:MAG: hypothetical protein AB7S81_02830 [Bdellovibrionales bacterium]